MKKKSIAFVMVVLLTVMMLFAGTATALNYSTSGSDPVGDTTNSDVDITHLSSEESGGEVTFTLRVAGEIKDYTGNEMYMYTIWASETETDSQNNGVMVYYDDGESMYAVYDDGTISGGDVATSNVQGDTLELTVPESAFSTMSGFNPWALTAYENDDTGAKASDNTYSWEWEDDGSGSNGGTSGDSNDTYDNETAENLIEKYILGSMLCIALAVIIPIVLIVIIIVVVLKVLSGGDEGGGQQSQQQRQQPPQQQQTPSGQQQGQQPPPPGQSGSGQNPPPPEDESGDEW